MEPRKLLRYQSTWTVAEVMSHLVGALSGTGPALVFGNFSAETVPSNIAVVISTSGSTGRAKNVAFTSGSLLASAKLSNEFLAAKPGDRWSLLVPPIHAAGLNVLVRSLELGTEPVTDPNIKVEFSAIVATQLYRALHGDEVLLNHLRNAKAVLLGGSAIDDSLLAAGKAAGINLITTYGMTETSGGCVYNGAPLPGVAIRINKTIEIKSPTLAADYLGDSSLWRQKMIDGYFISDDLGELENGLLKIKGRIDDVIISGGKNISLSEVETQLRANFPQVEIAAFGAPDKEWGTSLNLATVGNLNQNKINDFLHEKFGIKAMQLISLQEIPKSALGKIDRGALMNLLSKVD